MARFESPPTTWDELCAGYAPDVVDAMDRLRPIVQAALPDCTESVGGAKAMGFTKYWLETKSDMLAMITPQDTHVKLFVHHITNDATGRLKVEGTGASARHVKLPLGADWDEAAIADLLAQEAAARSA